MSIHSKEGSAPDTNQDDLGQLELEEIELLMLVSALLLQWEVKKRHLYLIESTHKE
jgi:hypothetical protein